MKRLLLITTLLSTFSFAAESFTACDSDKKTAKAALANQIITTIESSFSTNETVSSGLFDFNQKSSQRTIKSSSRLTLSDISFSTKEDQVCASISKETLIELAQGKIKAIQHYNLKELPADELTLIYYLEERLDQINQARAIVSLFPDTFSDEQRELMEKQHKSFTTERSKHHAQKISFVITPDSAELYIDGEKQQTHHNIYLKAQKHSYTIKAKDHADYTETFDLQARQKRTVTIDLAGQHYPRVTIMLTAKGVVKIDDKIVEANTPVVVKPGSHTYTVHAKGYCPISGSFEMALGEKKSIDVDHASYTFPQLTVNSNQEDAKLAINAEPYSLGKTKTFDSCGQKEVTYTVTFEDQVQNGTVVLEPGMIKTTSVNFLTRTDKKALREIAKIYRDKGRLLFYTALDIYDETELTVYGVDYIKHKEWLRYGYGVDYASENNATSTNVHLSVALQLTDWGSERLPLHLGTVALIPYIGGQIGFTHQNFGPDENDLSGKAIAGIDFAFTQSISFELFYQKNFYMEKEDRIGIALSLTNPF